MRKRNRARHVEPPVSRENGAAVMPLARSYDPIDEALCRVWIVRFFGNGETVCLDRERNTIVELHARDLRATRALLPRLKGRLPADVRLIMQDYGPWPALTEGRLAWLEGRDVAKGTHPEAKVERL